MASCELSVVIPAHNEELAIGGQLAALVSQDWAGHTWEIVVVDNRSTDRTAEVAATFDSPRVRVRVVSASERPGLSYTRNVGIEAAASDHIAICDADDEVEGGWVAAMGEALQTHQLVTGFLDVDSLNPQWLADSRGRSFQQGLIRFHGVFAVASGGNVGVHRDLWRRVGGFREGVEGAEDTLFSFEAWRLGVDVHFVPDAILRYRYRGDAGALWKQGRRYGSARVIVSKRMLQRGYPTSRIAGWKSWVWLLARVRLLQSHEGRAAWTWVAANRFGHLEGSIRERSLFL